MEIKKIVRGRVFRYGAALMGVLVVTLLLGPHYATVSSTTVALSFLLVVLIAATFFGRNPALLASLAAMLCFNYFFLPPVHTWTIADAENVVAWAAFTITAVVAGELSAFAQRRAREAERLYAELQTAFKSATEAEALKQSEKLKSALLDAVTHDLRTPLTSIKASVTTLLESEGGHRTVELDSNGRREFLDIINEETDRLNSFIEGMVELARLEAGPGGPGEALANVEEIIPAALARAESLPGNHRVVLSMEPELPLIRADARAIAEVLYNLIENAAKYSPAESTITVAAEQLENRLLISVNDEGEGIPEEMRERVFDKFVRIPGRRGGLGLGLAIARGITEAQGGRILAADGDNAKGTKMILTFPIEE